MEHQVKHGAVMLEMAGFFGHEGRGLTQVLGPLIIDTQSMHTVVATLTGDPL